MRIGVFGGSFDPVHIGHLMAAECCREQARLDRVLFVPVSIQPHKQQRQLASGQHRMEMLALATGGNDAFAVSSDELERGGVSYTVDTLERLRAQHPGDELLLMLGPDAFLGLPTWREPQRIVELATILAVMHGRNWLRLRSNSPRQTRPHAADTSSLPKPLVNRSPMPT